MFMLLILHQKEQPHFSYSFNEEFNKVHCDSDYNAKVSMCHEIPRKLNFAFIY